MIRRARPDEAEALCAIAFRSKAHWGYSDELMEACREELSVTGEDVEQHPVFVVHEGAEPLGFYTLEPLPDGAIELGHLFVEPRAIGRGLGAQLMAHACDQARARGHRLLVIQSDPNAEGFYVGCGAKRVGVQASASVRGRELPLLELDLGA